jgi:hypothetical protein
MPRLKIVVSTVFPAIIAAVFWWISKGKERESDANKREKRASEGIVYKLEREKSIRGNRIQIREREKSKSGRSHQMITAIVRGKTVVRTSKSQRKIVIRNESILLFYWNLLSLLFWL